MPHVIITYTQTVPCIIFYKLSLSLNISQLFEEGVTNLTLCPEFIVLSKIMGPYYEGRTESHEQLFFACNLGTADEREYGGRWNQLLC
jgi:hypothetical protein